MKKVFLFLCFLLMLALPGLAETVPPCETHTFPDSVSCEDGEVTCSVCGAPYDGEVRHNTDSVWDYDAMYHWFTCTKCGEICEKSGHLNCCTNPGVCAECGNPTVNLVLHNYTGDYSYDEATHWFPCQDCDEKLSQEPHRAFCDAPGVCVDCGAPYSGPVDHWPDYDNPRHDDTHHWFGCTQCDALEADKRPHEAACENPGVCELCGVPCTAMRHMMDDHERDFLTSDEKTHWYQCPGCDQRVWEEQHWAGCTLPGFCAVCGQACSGAVIHDINWDQPESDATHHWWTCRACGTFSKDAHTVNCAQPGECEICGAPVDIVPVHVRDESVAVVSAPDTHTYVCAVCGEPITEPHQWGQDGLCVYGCQPHTHQWTVSSTTPSTCTQAGVTRYACVCGEVREESIPASGHSYESRVVAPTCREAGYTLHVCACGDQYQDNATPASGHHWKETERTAPQCTAEGRVTYRCSACGLKKVDLTPATDHQYALTGRSEPDCTRDGALTYTCVCGATREEALPATGHAYDNVYAARGDGTHAALCQKGCGQERVKPCEFQDVEVGGLKCALCAVCGYTRYQAAVEADAPAGETEQEQVTAAVENARIEAVEENALPAGSTLVVREQTALLAPEGGALRLFTVALAQDGENLELGGRACIRIPCENAEQMRLVLLLPDGTQQEIAFEIVHGMLVFETRLLGVFALLPLEA